MSNIITHAFEGAEVRVLVDDAGEPWFAAPDLARVLGYRDAPTATRGLEDDEKGTQIVCTLGGPQEITTVSEAGLYSLILRSRVEGARRFKRWVTHEVLPSIRKTGRYGAPDPMAILADPAAMRGLLLTYAERTLELEAGLRERDNRIGQMAPKAEALDRIATQADGSLCVTDAAKALQVRPKDLFDWLHAHKWIYRRAGGKNWLGYQDRVQSGNLEHKVTIVVCPDGEKVREQVLVTAKGLARLASVFGGAAS